MTTQAPAPEKGPTRAGFIDRAMSGIERVGNKLPHPVLLFLGLFVLVGAASTALAAAGATVTIPGEDKTVAVKGVFTGDGVVWLLENFIPNFTGFPSLGTVLLMMAAVGVAERTGLLETMVRASISRAPVWLLPYLVAFVAAQAHLMSDVAILVIPPLAALVFKNAGRNPVAGLIGGFACVCAGYAAGFTIGALDALYTGITHQAAQVLPQGGDAPTHILINYFYTASASVVLALIGGFLISRVLEPRLPQPTGDGTESDGEVTTEVTALQRRGMLRAGLVVLARRPNSAPCSRGCRCSWSRSSWPGSRCWASSTASTYRWGRGPRSAHPEPSCTRFLHIAATAHAHGIWSRGSTGTNEGGTSCATATPCPQPPPSPRSPRPCRPRRPPSTPRP
ncbi:AbgT family transporter [Streptomyces sp. NPDC051684]|uniref:AbgT family transporter n=1 Tax=Streptomyces sp. NPDC051684 TaxID=3365670 RepID=UPI0037AE9284